MHINKNQNCNCSNYKCMNKKNNNKTFINSFFEVENFLRKAKEICKGIKLYKLFK